MPRRAGVYKPSAAIFDILKFHILKPSKLPLRRAHSVLDVDDIIRNNNICVLTCYRSADTEPDQLA